MMSDTTRFSCRLKSFWIICVVIINASFSNVCFAAEKRIVSLSPALTEWVFAFGLDKQLSGVTEQCDHPSEALRKEKVGSFMRVSLERVFALRATDVVVGDGLPPLMLRKLRESGIRVHIFHPLRFSDFPAQISALGRNLGAPERGVQWADKFERVLTDSKGSKPNRKPKRALFFLSAEPIWLVGPGVWMSDLFSLKGIENSLPSGFAREAFPRVSFEAIAKMDARVWYGFADGKSASEASATQLSALRARLGRKDDIDVLVLPASEFQRPGPRLLDAVRRLGDSQL